MGLIQVMPESLANQIAAGEVVERPAACVKELVENSLDAGAKHVLVNLVEGGISLMSVQDDGRGMDKEDVVLAFERHATSKVKHSRDLFSIATLGFRGEALASIAAVAKVALSSRTADQADGIEYCIAGTDQRTEPTAVGMPQGTRVEVTDLFFNTPARLKYLKSVATEQSRSIEVVQRIALGRPDVAFTCRVDDNVVFRSDGRGDPRTVLAALYGVGEAQQFLHVDLQSADYRVTGFVGRPTQSRSNRAHGYLYINGRSIRNVAIHQAIVAAYGGRLMVNRHPMYALSIDMDPKLVDVNIHPHKSEVRFSEERDVTGLVQEAVKNALDKAFLVSDGADALLTRTRFQEKSASPLSGPRMSGSRASFRPNTRPSSDGLLFRMEPTSQPVSGLSPQVLQTVYGPTEMRSQAGGPAAESENEVAATAELSRDATEEYSATEAGKVDRNWVGEDETDESELSRPNHWQLRPVGQALGMYIIADDGDSLYIIDQHALHEKILYEKFHKAMNEREVGRIPLLTPVVARLTAAERSTLAAHLNQLNALGLDVEAFGGEDLVVRTVPVIWEGLDFPTLVTTTLAELGSGTVPNVMDALKNQLIMKACKAAIKANHHLSSAEMDALCSALSDLDDPFHCPHGRPIIIRMTNRDLEKGFKRIV